MTLTTPNTTCINKPEVTWWLSADGKNPCELLSTLLRRCNQKFVLGNTPAVPTTPRQICSDAAVAAGNATDYNPCCCNSVAYSLRQACWSCQWGATDPDAALGHRPTFGEYLQCTDTPQPGIGLDQQPEWTRLPIGAGDIWNFTATELFALNNTGTPTLPVPINPPVKTTKPSPISSVTPAGGSPVKTVGPGAIVGILGGILALLFLVCGLAWWYTIYRKRRRIESGNEAASPLTWTRGLWRAHTVRPAVGGAAYPFSPTEMRQAQAVPPPPAYDLEAGPSVEPTQSGGSSLAGGPASAQPVARARTEKRRA